MSAGTGTTEEARLWTGDDGETAYLVTLWPSGAVEVATRNVAGGTRQRWSLPVELSEAS